MKIEKEYYENDIKITRVSMKKIKNVNPITKKPYLAERSLF